MSYQIDVDASPDASEQQRRELEQVAQRVAWAVQDQEQRHYRENLQQVVNEVARTVADYVLRVAGPQLIEIGRQQERQGGEAALVRDFGATLTASLDQLQAAGGEIAGLLRELVDRETQTKAKTVKVERGRGGLITGLSVEE
jgi:hypothetical protein